MEKKTTMKAKNLFIAFFILFGLHSCIEDTVQLDELSRDVEMERSISIPLIKTSVSYEDIGGGGWEYTDLLPTGDTIFFYLVEDVSYQDTMDFGGFDIDLDFDYIRIHHKITNKLPLNLFFNLYLYDEEAEQTIDTISFIEPGEDYFIFAPTEFLANGLIDEDQLETREGTVELNAGLLDNLFNNTSHIVINAEVAEQDTIVKILGHYGIDMELGFSARGRIITNLDSLTQPTEEL